MKVFFNPVTHAGPLPSPCISICRMHPQTGLCEGCLRTTDEITLWGAATEDFKRAVWMELMVRRCKQEADALSSNIHFDATSSD